MDARADGRMDERKKEWRALKERNKDRKKKEMYWSPFHEAVYDRTNS